MQAKLLMVRANRRFFSAMYFNSACENGSSAWCLPLK